MEPTDSDQKVSTATDADVEKLEQQAAEVSSAVASLLAEIDDLSEETATELQVSRLHREATSVLQQAQQLVDQVEQIHRLTFNTGTMPREVTQRHVDRISGEYPPPVNMVALMFLSHNRRRFLTHKPETRGAEIVRQQGLTESQQELLRDITDQLSANSGESQQPRH